ncbi:hypothetical protein TDB9533_02197 [Thalassocella blandensis]|nr:hypothetical protein TDB9533_02197 [Thalassocella blandensis]
MLVQQQLENITQLNSNPYYSLEAKGPLIDRVYSMRYRSYSADDYISKCETKKFMDEYDPMPNCTSYLTYFEKKAIGSIRSCIFDPKCEINRVPVMDVFESELGDIVGYDKTFIEANKFVIDPSFQRKGGVKARFSIYKNIADSILENNAKYLVAGIRPEHIKFYRMLNFKPMSDVKSYPHLKFLTLLVVCEDVMGFVDRIYSKTNKPEVREIVNGSLLSYGTH